MMDDLGDRWYMAQHLFDFLERYGIAHCVVGDTRCYPETIPSDVDIVVPREVFPEIPRMMAQFCLERDVRLVQLIRHEQTAAYFVLSWVGHSGELRFLAPDICSDYFRGGRQLLAADEILAQRGMATDDAGEPKGFYVPPAPVQFIYYLLKKIDKQELNDDHGEYLSARWGEDPSCAWSETCRFWPRPDDARLIAHAAATNDWSAVRGALPRLRRALHRGVPFSLRGALGEWCRRAARVLRPTGLVMVVLGPDGCGKSSVINRMLDELAPVFRRTGYFHLRPRIFAGSKTVPLRVTQPHAQPARGTLASLAKLAYFFFDYLAGCVVRVWPLAVRSTLVVFDRYYHDLLVDPRRYRFGGPMPLARWVARYVPAPDMWVVLDAPPDILQARKAEVSADESERQRYGYLELVRGRWNATIVDASQELSRVVSDVETAVLRFLEQRLESRHPGLRARENSGPARLLLFFCRREVPVLSRLIRTVFNCDIYCRIRSPIHLPHPYGIIIHCKTEIGRRVTVMQQVTLGPKNWGENLAPVIEDDVWVGAGAKVLGAVRVGKGAVIGANAVVTRDVPPYCTVVGANRIVRRGVLSELRGRARPPAGARAMDSEPLRITGGRYSRSSLPRNF
jgi:thymidylate kinase